MPLIIKIETKIEELSNDFDLIPDIRKELLINFAEYISTKIGEDKEVNLTFICTHNSRRSHMSQIWAQVAAEHFLIPNIHCYSGGTEATAFNLRAVRAIMDAGFKIEQKDESDNPIYLVNYSDDKESIKCFSKVYSDSFNPQSDFAAIVTCSDADKNCPIVLGAEVRFPIKYNDPKEYDGTELEEEKYIDRSEQIGIEMLFAFSKVRVV